MTRRSAQLLHGAGSMALLAVLLVGPPLALSKLVGWPLPTQIPDLDTIELAIRSGISDDLVVKGLAIVAWLAWMQIVLAVVVEVVALVRGRPSTRMPVLPGLQANVGRLVASVAMMTATLPPATPSVAAAPPMPVVAAEVEVPVAPSPAMDPIRRSFTPAVPAGRSPTPSSAAPTSRATITVERHDSYWAIAERALGDGYRWREVRDLNVGRTMTTGHVVQPGSDLVMPGWVLELPDGARVDPAPPPAVDGAAATTHAEIVVDPGDNFWSLAEEQLATATGQEPDDIETAPYWLDMIDANRDRLVQPGNPNLIIPGQRLTVPPVPGSLPTGGPTSGTVPADPGIDPPPDPPAVPPAEPGPQAEPTSPPEDLPAETTPTTIESATLPPAPLNDGAGQSDRASTPSGADTADDESEPSELPVPAIVAGLASAALAVGATRAIRRGRLRSAHRSPGSPPQPTSSEATNFHRTLIAAADVEGIDGLRNALGRLAVPLADSGPPVRPRVVQHGKDHLDVYLDQPSDSPPRGWSADAGGAVWSYSGAEIDDRDEDPPCATPLLVTLGRPDDGGQLYLDLEAEGVIALVGEPAAARAVARAILTELALTPLADTLEVLVIGDLAPPEVTELDHVMLADSWDDVAEDLLFWTKQSHEVLADNDWPNAFVARGIDPYRDALAPIVAIASEPPPSDLTDAMSDHPLATLTVVAVGAVEGATTIDCRADLLTVTDLGLEVTPYPMEPESLEALVELVREPDEEEDVIRQGDQLSLLSSALVGDTGGESDDGVPEEDPAYEILVRALGEIRVEGGKPLSSKQTALIAYIALNGVVTADKLEDAIWGASTATARRKRLANTISESRAALGRHHFPPASDGRYRAGPAVATDLQLFDQRVRRAAMQPATEAAETLRSALDLVTGPPFTYRGADRTAFSWVDLESWASTWELKVAAVAQRCAELLLDVGQTEDAIEAAAHALSFMPTHTSLTETVMRAHAANGDRLAVRRVYDDHVQAMAALDLDADVSTEELLREFANPPGRQGSGR